MRKQITTFYVETLLLIMVFVGIILVLTQVFGASKLQSSQAQQLTNAVCLAENAAEAFASADSPETLVSLLNENDNAAYVPDTGTVWAYYNGDMTPANGELAVKITWEPRDGLISSEITVYQWPSEQVLYTLDTAVYRREGTG